MLGKIDIRKILKEHNDTLILKTTKDKVVKDEPICFLFFIFPFMISIGYYLLNGGFSKETVITLLITFSIFTPLLFSLLPIIYDLSNKKLSNYGFELVNEFKSNVLFVILVSLTTLSLLIMEFLLYGKGINSIFTIIILGLFINIALTILMIIQSFNFFMNQFIKMRKEERKKEKEFEKKKEELLNKLLEK